MSVVDLAEFPRDTLHAHARRYANLGWHVFPCAKDKRPLTEHGFQDATMDSEQIDAWWERWPDALIGVACGASELAVIDHDPKNDPDGAGREKLFDLLGNVGTKQQETGSGGRHWFFLAPRGIEIRNSAGAIGPGVDVRGNGGYVIVSPSISEMGPYRWLNRAEFQALPEAIIKVLTSPEAKRKIDEQTPDGKIPSGQRNQRLCSLAGTFRKRNMAPLAIEHALLAENQQHCDPPLPEEEVRKIAHGIVERYPAEEPLQVGEVKVEVLADDSVEIRLLLGDGQPCTFTFTEMEKDKKELTCHLDISSAHMSEPFQQRINIESSSGRLDLRRELDGLYGKGPGWAKALNSVWSRARSAYLDQDRSIASSDIPLLEGLRFLIDPIMVADGTTILFGDGSSSKSYISMMLALAAEVGGQAAGRFVPIPSRVMYIDYEDSESNFRVRRDRVLRGMGIVPESVSGPRYWRANGIPLRDQADAIRRACERHEIDWLIVDSAVPACGGAPEEAATATAFFSAVRRIGRPVLLIAHINKSDSELATQKPFGSSFFHNLARRTWFVKRIQEQESDEVDVALFCRKVNDGRLPSPVGIHVSFEGDQGPVIFRSNDPNANSELIRLTSPQNRVWAALTTPRTVREIMEITDLTEKAVRKVLLDAPTRFKEVEKMPHESTGGRPTLVWGRIVHGYEEEF